jgi:uncharacterized protein YegP (UPF0339 family)
MSATRLWLTARFDDNGQGILMTEGYTSEKDAKLGISLLVKKAHKQRYEVYSYTPQSKAALLRKHHIELRQ